MTLPELTRQLDPEPLGREMHALIGRLYPICRSITGNGVRRSLSILQEYAALEMRELSTGMQVLDWVIPEEWNIHDAYIADLHGRRVVDFQENTLHVMSYSTPVSERISVEQLRRHLHTIPDQPTVIPYRTSYYRKDWGFCLSQAVYDQLADAEYDVVIDSELTNGSLTYGELVLPGETESEVLLSAHCCHPSMCNDNLSGVVLLIKLAGLLAGLRRHYTYRFLFVPGTIGSIAWLAQNEPVTSLIRHGLVAACVGDAGRFTYKRSRLGDAEIDRVVQVVLRDSRHEFGVRPFTPYGYDERQYCSPGFNLPVGVLSRTPYGEFPEYHTSADNLDFVKPAYLGESLLVYAKVLEVLESNRVYRNLSPKGEPQLGRRGLYSDVGGRKKSGDQELAMLWALNQCDGTKSLLDIAETSGMGFDVISQAARELERNNLLVQV